VNAIRIFQTTIHELYTFLPGPSRLILATLRLLQQMRFHRKHTNLCQGYTCLLGTKVLRFRERNVVSFHLRLSPICPLASALGGEGTLAPSRTAYGSLRVPHGPCAAHLSIRTYPSDSPSPKQAGLLRQSIYLAQCLEESASFSLASFSRPSILDTSHWSLAAPLIIRIIFSGSAAMRAN
jgi:hypothetical protein